MKQFEHGGNYTTDILDFSVNINPLGLPQSVKEVLKCSIDSFTKYPDPYCTELIKKISENENISPKKIVCGNGADDLIYRLIYAVKPSHALLTAPTFTEYEKALTEIGCKLRFHTLSESENFILTSRIFNDLHDVDIVFLCNPNNPTGSVIEPELLSDIIRYCSKHNILLVIDECFFGFCDKVSLSITDNIVVLKAFTKLYAMAGLRLGYMLFGNAEIAKKVWNIGQYWSVSVPAQLAGTVALDEKEYLYKSITLIKNERKYLSESLSSMGIKVYPSDANFIFFKCGFPIDKLLLNEGIAIRNCENFRSLNNDFFRIAVRKHNENVRLINAVKKIMGVQKCQNQL